MEIFLLYCRAATLTTAIAKALALLDAFPDNGRAMGAAELASALRLSKSTVHRDLAELAAVGLLDYHDGRYRLGWRIVELAESITGWTRPMREAALPYLLDFYERTHATITLAVLLPEAVLCVERLFGHQRLPISTRIGDRLPLHCTALGKVLLAFDPSWPRRLSPRGAFTAVTARTITSPRALARQLREVSDRGYALVDGEMTLGVACIAAPVFARPGGIATAAIAAAIPSANLDPVPLGDGVRKTAHAVSLCLQGLSTREPRAAGKPWHQGR